MASSGTVAGDEWRGRVGSTWATEWARTDRSFRNLTGRLIDAIDSALPTGAPSRRVLDIGCGAGETALRLARQRPDLAVTGVDLSEALVDAARQRSQGCPNVDYAVGDASGWEPTTSFDAALSRHGVMFFDDPVAAFAHIRSLLAPGAPLAFTCFADRAANGWASGLASVVAMPPSPDPDAPGPFAFADPDRVAAILAAAGWRDAVPKRIDYGYVAGGGDDPVADGSAFFTQIGPVARYLATLEPAARSALLPRIADWLRDHVAGGEVVLPAAAWLWRATA